MGLGGGGAQGTFAAAGAGAGEYGDLVQGWDDDDNAVDGDPPDFHPHVL